MTRANSIALTAQGQPYLAELRAFFDSLDDRDFLWHLYDSRSGRGPNGYSVDSLWRAHLLSYRLNIGNDCELIRRLQDSSDLRQLCGFRYNDQVPSKATFSRFNKLLAQHPELTEPLYQQLIEKTRVHYPDLGENVVTDSTSIESYGNPWKNSDPDARSGVKHDARSTKNGATEYFYGYKLHTVADAKYEIPLTHIVTSGNKNDSPWLRDTVKKAKATFNWFQPVSLSADRGYDSQKNHDFLHGLGIAAVIHIKKNANRLVSDYGELATLRGQPYCLGKRPMQYVLTDTETGKHLYECPAKDCLWRPLNPAGNQHCRLVCWLEPAKNLRLIGGLIARASIQWRDLYRQRQSIERMFKSMKQSRCLDRPNRMGLIKVCHHALISSMSYVMTVLAKLNAGMTEDTRWMVRRVG